MASIDQWLVTWTALGVQASARLQEFYVELMNRYAEPHRHYHTSQHLAECFERWQDLRPYAVHPAEVEAAIWYHDAIYDIHSTDNEAHSATLAQDTALTLGVSWGSAGRIQNLILSTRHPIQPVGIDAELLVDIDLSILGAEPARFDEYEQQIRQEYAWMPEQSFREGRSAILRQFLARPHIFSTALFRERYEQQARENLRRSLEALAGE